MKGSLVLGMLGIAGTFAVIVGSHSRRRGAAAEKMDTSRCRWIPPADKDIPPDVVKRAVELQALGQPLGTEYVEEVGGQIWKFRREIHGPNEQNPQPHLGVGVRRCELGATKPSQTGVPA